MIRLTVFLMFAVAVSVASNAIYRIPHCDPCIEEDCKIDLNNCIFGAVKSFCGKMTCGQGPSMPCGARRGKCGEGMDCTCGVCTGCSLKTLECNYDVRDSLCV